MKGGKQRQTLGAGLLLLSILFLGIAHIAVLPPWEGFDETGHYSYIRQLADRGASTLPRDQARIDAAIDAYAHIGPMPYPSTLSARNDDMTTYAAFFNGPPQRHEALRNHLFAAATDPPAFAPGAAMNWQRQHPPLYYVLMAGLARMSEPLPLGPRLFLWRSVSYGLAFAGLCLAFAANRRAMAALAPGRAVPTATLAAWPLLLPMWFSDTARLGNDSLAVLLMGLAWYLLVGHGDRGPGLRRHTLLGLVLGLGCWVKAFFLPISAGVAVYLCLRWWADRASATSSAFPLANFFGLLLAIAGPLYVSTLVQTGTLLGTNDPLLFAQGGEWPLPSNGSDVVLPFLRSLAAMAKSFVWSGTWSFGRPPLGYLLPTSMLVAVVGGGYGAWLARRRSLVGGLPLLVAAPVVAGLSYHALSWILIAGKTAVTPGWYLFILAGPIGLMAGAGVQWLKDRSAGRIALFVLTAAAAAFSVLVTGMQGLMYSGCAVKQEAERALNFIPGDRCWLDAGQVFQRLDVIGFPTVGALALAGAALALAGAALVLRPR